VLALAYRPEYAERNDVFVWLVASQALLYVAGTAGVAITAMRVFRVQVPVQVANSGVLLVLFACWIRGDGLLGAAQASLAGSALLTAAYGVLARISMRRLARRAS
jgi:pheromone shutdown protein TraB